MKKEICICLIIVIAIIIGDILLQKYTDNSLNIVSGKLEEIKLNLENDEKINNIMEEADSEWEKRFNILTCFLEHDELEKVKTQLVIIKSEISTNDREHIYEELDKTIYILNHIKDKQKLKIDNIF